jgi:hypothetical protein
MMESFTEEGNTSINRGNGFVANGHTWTNESLDLKDSCRCNKKER